MSETNTKRQMASPELRAQLTLSAADLATGRLTLLRSTLAAIHQRASRRLESRQAKADKVKVAEAG